MFLYLRCIAPASRDKIRIYQARLIHVPHPYPSKSPHPHYAFGGCGTKKVVHKFLSLREIQWQLWLPYYHSDSRPEGPLGPETCRLLLLTHTGLPQTPCTSPSSRERRPRDNCEIRQRVGASQTRSRHQRAVAKKKQKNRQDTERSGNQKNGSSTSHVENRPQTPGEAAPA